MNTHVDFNTAKLLKEKGFDNETLHFYTKPRSKMFGIDEHHRAYPIKNISKKLYTAGCQVALNVENIYLAPTIAEVVMWLYEKHEIWIEVRKHTRDMLLCFSPYIDNTPINSDVFFNDYDSPTEAYQEAINYTLKNLIK